VALRQGDFAAYGEELDRLEAALRRLVELTSRRDSNPALPYGEPG
jgi:hypothetical protein